MMILMIKDAKQGFIANFEIPIAIQIQYFNCSIFVFVMRKIIEASE
jgi:hypothetical protein